MHGGSKSTSICCISAVHSQLMYIVLLLRKPEDVTVSFLSSTEPHSKLPQYTVYVSALLTLIFFTKLLGNFFL